MAVSGILFTDLTGINETWWTVGAEPTALPTSTLIAIEVRAPRSAPPSPVPRLKRWRVSDGSAPPATDHSLVLSYIYRWW